MKTRKYELRIRESRIPYLAVVGYVEIGKDEIRRTPNEIADIIWKAYHPERLAEEYVYMVAFDNKLHLIGLFEVAHGTSTESTISTKQILQRALLSGAVTICIAHNHPSGGVKPSKDDDRFTERLSDAAELCDIQVADHIIIAGACRKEIYSYRSHDRIL